MIVWIMISILFIIVLWRCYKNNRTVTRAELSALLVFYFVTMLIVMVCHSRTYTASPFRMEYNAQMCHINKTKDLVTVQTPDARTFAVRADQYVIYEAPNKESEVVEVDGSLRIYSHDAPEWLYKLYFMEDPIPSTEYVIDRINVSKAN